MLSIRVSSLLNLAFRKIYNENNNASNRIEGDGLDELKDETNVKTVLLGNAE